MLSFPTSSQKHAEKLESPGVETRTSSEASLLTESVTMITMVIRSMSSM